MLNRHSAFSDASFVVVEGGWERFMKKLHKGMKLQARIVACFENQKYLLRIWGYNLMMRSEFNFKRFEEVELIVKEMTPTLVLVPASRQSAMLKTTASARKDLQEIDMLA